MMYDWIWSRRGKKKKKKEAPLTSFNEHQHKTEHSNYVKGKKKSWEPVRRHASTGHLLQRKMPIRSEFLILELLVRHNDKWWSQIRHCHIRVPHFGVTGLGTMTNDGHRYDTVTLECLILVLLVRHNDKWWSHTWRCHISAKQCQTMLTMPRHFGLTMSWHTD